MSNMRQLGIVQNLYCGDNNDYLCEPNWDSGVVGKPIGWFYNPNATAGGGNGSGIPDPFNLPYKNQGEAASYNGLYCPYMKNGKVFLCPKEWQRGQRNLHLSLTKPRPFPDSEPFKLRITAV